MGLFERDHVKASTVAYWMAFLAWAGTPQSEGGASFTKYGAGLAKRLSVGKRSDGSLINADGSPAPWTIMLGGELPAGALRTPWTNSGTDTADAHPSDSLWVVSQEDEGAPMYYMVAGDFGNWKSKLRELGKRFKYDAFIAKKGKTWAGFIIGLTAVATVVVSIVATPAAGAAVAAAGSALAAAVADGKFSSEDIERASEDGTLDTLAATTAAAAGADPATVSTLTDAATAAVDAAATTGEDPATVPTATDTTDTSDTPASSGKGKVIAAVLGVLALIGIGVGVAVTRKGGDNAKG